MKTYALLLLMTVSGSLLAQNSADLQESKVYTPNEQANFAAGELIKHLNIQDRTEYSNVLKACDEYYIAISISGIANNPEEMAVAQENMDKEIKRIVGNNRMEDYQTWKNKPKFYAPVDYAQD